MEPISNIRECKDLYLNLGLYIAACDTPLPGVDLPPPPQFCDMAFFFEPPENVDNASTRPINLHPDVTHAQSLNYNNIDIEIWREFQRRLGLYILSCQSLNSQVEHAHIGGFSFELCYPEITVPQIPLLYNIVNQIGSSTPQNADDDVGGQPSGNLTSLAEASPPVAPAQQNSPLQPLGGSSSGVSPIDLNRLSIALNLLTGFLYTSHQDGISDLTVERKNAEAVNISKQDRLVEDLKRNTRGFDLRTIEKREAEIDRAVEAAKAEAGKLIHPSLGANQGQERNLYTQAAKLKARLGPQLSTVFSPSSTPLPYSSYCRIHRRFCSSPPSFGIPHYTPSLGSPLGQNWPSFSRVMNDSFTTQFAESLVQTEALRLDIAHFEQCTRVLSVLARALCFLDWGVALYNHNNAAISLLTSQFTATATGSAISEVISWSPHVENKFFVQDLSAFQAPGSSPLHTPSRFALLFAGLLVRLVLSDLDSGSDIGLPEEPGEK